MAAKGLAEDAAIQVRKEEWAEAYRHTPHGQPCRASRRPGSAATEVAKEAPLDSARYGGPVVGRVGPSFLLFSQTITVVIPQKGPRRICSKSYVKSSEWRMDFAVERERPNPVDQRLG